MTSDCEGDNWIDECKKLRQGRDWCVLLVTADLVQSNESANQCTFAEEYGIRMVGVLTDNKWIEAMTKAR